MRLLRSASFAAALVVGCACTLSTARVAASGTPAAQASLESVVGDYEAQSRIIQIRLRPDDVLTIAMPSQPIRELEPLGNLQFAQKGLTGYKIMFVRDGSGNVNALMALQPGGWYRAARLGGAKKPEPRAPAASTPARSTSSLPVRPPLSKRRPLAFDQLVFPTLIAAVYDGDFNTMPDYQSVRDYFVSIEEVFNRACYPAFLGTAEATQAYWSTEGRNVLRDLSRAVNNAVSNPDATLDSVNEMFTRWANGGFKADHSIANEGIRDGSVLVQRHTCESLEVIQFRRGLHRLFVSRRDVRAAPDNPGRIAALVNPRLRQQLGVHPPAEIVSTPVETLTDACIDSWRRTVLPNRIGRPEAVMLEGTDWCRCLAPKMLDAHLSSDDMAALRANFVNEQGRIRDASTNKALKNACYNK